MQHRLVSGPGRWDCLRHLIRAALCAAMLMGIHHAARAQEFYVLGGLQQTPAATTVRIRSEKTQVLDGPYADAKEQLGGFHIIEVPDLDAAISWAARSPTALHGVVEVRPMHERDLLTEDISKYLKPEQRLS